MTIQCFGPVVATLEYTKSRLAERSTWLAIGVGVGGAAALTSPWSFIALAVAVIGAIVPTTSTSGEA